MTPIRRYRRGLTGSPLEDWIMERLEAPSPPPACPGCSGPMGDGDRAHYGRCGRCAGRYPDLPPVARSARRCWCGRRVSTLPDGNGFECAEHDGPVPDTGPADPLTPGGVLDRRYP